MVRRVAANYLFVAHSISKIKMFFSLFHSRDSERTVRGRKRYVKGQNCEGETPLER